MKEMKRNNNCICLNKWFGVYLWEIVICAEQSNPNNILHEVVTYVIKYHLKLWIELIRDRKYCQASFRLLKYFFFFPFFLLFFFYLFFKWRELAIVGNKARFIDILTLKLIDNANNVKCICFENILKNLLIIIHSFHEISIILKCLP